MSETFHDDYRREEDAKGSSDRAFGLVFAALFAIIGLWPLLDVAMPRIWALVICGAFLLVAWLRPRLLRPLNRMWMRFGLLLHRIVNPLLMGLIFYTTVTPIGLVMRILGKDPLGLRFSKELKSYWIARQPPGPAPDSMRHQF